MVTTTVKITALMLVLALAGHHAKAVEPTVIYLSCDGTYKIAGDATKTLFPVKKLGLIVNLVASAVSGFPSVATITNVSDTTVQFMGTTASPSGGTSAWGTIDRVTGKTSATTTNTGERWEGHSLERVFDLVCTVTNRLF